MINFYRITSVNDKFFNEFFDLYSEAFPESERRSPEGFVNVLESEKKFYANALVQKDVFVGFFNYWTFDDFFYIEHFALTSNFRNQKIGTKALETFKSQVKLPTVIEVELPNDANSTRRIKFYENTGFIGLDNYYAQPPYEKKGFLLPMMIMCDDFNFASTNFEKIMETLYEEVYHYSIVNKHPMFK